VVAKLLFGQSDGVVELTVGSVGTAVSLTATARPG
jgi:hypothetical protein